MGAAVSSVRHGSAPPASWTSALASHDTDGVILVTSELTMPQLRQVREEGIPLVVVDPVNLPEPDLPSVGATNWAGGLAATDHLLGLGHRRIGAIGRPGRLPVQPGPDRRLPVGAERAGVAFDRALVRHGDFQHEGGFLRGGELLDLDPADRDLRRQRPAGAGRLRGRAAARPADPAGPDGRRLRRPAGRPLGVAAADHGPPAARRDGPGGRADARRSDRDGPLRSQRVELSTELITRESTGPVRSAGLR